MRRKLLAIFALLFSATLSAQVAGDLDVTFGEGGKVICPISNDSYLVDVIQNLAVQPDGKIIAAGSSRGGSQKRFTLARYNENGTLDNTFGDGGIVILPPNNNYSNFIMAAEVLDNGKILACGRIYDPTETNGISSRPVLIKLLSDGSLDNTFGDGGYVVGSFGSHNVLPEKMALQSDGKIVLCGYYDDNMMALRYNVDGTIDQNYGENGVCVIRIQQGTSYAKDLAIQNDNKTIVAGYYNGSGCPKWSIARINEEGNLDSTFGENGLVLESIGTGNDFCTSVKIQPDGQIVVGGHTWTANAPQLRYSFAVARLNTTGSLDPSFGIGGISTMEITDIEENYISGLAIAPTSGNIYAAINAYSTIQNRYDMGILCFKPNGYVNEDFGEHGYALTNINGGRNDITSIVLQSDGKAVIGGEALSDASTGSPFAMARFLTLESSPASICNNTIVKKLDIYPNPAREKLNIECEYAQFTVQVIDVATGRTLINMQNTKNIDVSVLSAGTYIIRVVSNNKIFTNQFIKL